MNKQVAVRAGGSRAEHKSIDHSTLLSTVSIHQELRGMGGADDEYGSGCSRVRCKSHVTPSFSLYMGEARVERQEKSETGNSFYNWASLP